MPDDFALDAMTMKQEGDYLRNGTTRQMYVYRFYLGTQGPFTFKTPVEGFTGTEFSQHVEQLRTHLRVAAPQ